MQKEKMGNIKFTQAKTQACIKRFMQLCFTNQEVNTITDVHFCALHYRLLCPSFQINI